MSDDTSKMKYTKYCRKCDTAFESKDRFCTKCGSELIEYHEQSNDEILSIQRKFYAITSEYEYLAQISNYNSDIKRLLSIYEPHPVLQEAKKDTVFWDAPVQIVHDERYMRTKFFVLILPLILMVVFTASMGTTMGALCLLFVDPIVVLLVIKWWFNTRKEEIERLKNTDEYKRLDAIRSQRYAEKERLATDQFLHRQSALIDDFIQQSEEWFNRCGSRFYDLAIKWQNENKKLIESYFAKLAKERAELAKERMESEKKELAAYQAELDYRKNAKKQNELMRMSDSELQRKTAELKRRLGE